MPKPGSGATLIGASPFATGLIGAWLFNEGTGIAGDRIADHSGHEHHGVIERSGSGQPPQTYWGQVDPEHDPAFILDEASLNMWCRVPHHSDFNFAGPFTVAVGYVASPVSALGPNDVLVGKASTDGFNDGFTIYTSAASKVKFGFVGSSFANAAVDPTVTPAYSNSSYHQVVLAFDSANADLFGYVDAVQVASETTQSAHVPSSVDLYLGRQGNIVIRPWNGFLFYVYIWNRLLSPDEIASLSANPYQMWDPPGTTLAPAMEEVMRDFPELVHPVVELTLDGALYKFAEYPVAAASKGQYFPYVESFGDTTRRANLHDFSLEIPQFDVTIYDEDRVLQKLMGGPLRGGKIEGSLVETWWRTSKPDIDPSLHYRDFTGVIHTPGGAGDRRYRFSCRADVTKLEGPPQIPSFNTLHFPSAPERARGEPLWVVYGRHLSSSVADSKGMIECLPAEDVGGNVDLWIASYGALFRVARVFLDDVENSNFSTFVLQRGNALYQMVKYTGGDPHPTKDSKVTIDCEGLMTSPLNGDLISNPAAQLRHFLNVFVYGTGDTRPLAAWPNDADHPMSTLYFNRAESHFAKPRMEGGMVIYSNEKSIDVLNKWGKTYSAAPFLTDTFELAVAARNLADTAIYLDDRHVVQKLNHALSDLNFGVVSKAPPSELNVHHLFDEARGKFTQTDLVANRRAGLPILGESFDQHYARRATLQPFE